MEISLNGAVWFKMCDKKKEILCQNVTREMPAKLREHT